MTDAASGSAIQAGTRKEGPSPIAGSNAGCRCEADRRSRSRTAGTAGGTDKRPLPRVPGSGHYEVASDEGAENWAVLATHLVRDAVVYVRQSTAFKVVQNLESQRRQYGLTGRARQLGWPDVAVIDDDLGRGETWTTVRVRHLRERLGVAGFDPWRKGWVSPVGYASRICDFQQKIATYRHPDPNRGQIVFACILLATRLELAPD